MTVFLVTHPDFDDELIKAENESAAREVYTSDLSERGKASIEATPYLIVEATPENLIKFLPFEEHRNQLELSYMKYDPTDPVEA